MAFCSCMRTACCLLELLATLVCRGEVTTKKRGLFPSPFVHAFHFLAKIALQASFREQCGACHCSLRVFCPEVPRRRLAPVSGRFPLSLSRCFQSGTTGSCSLFNKIVSGLGSPGSHLPISAFTPWKVQRAASAIANIAATFPSFTQGIYYALEEGETLDTPGVRLPSVKEFFADLKELNGIIHSGTQLAFDATRPTSHSSCRCVGV